MFKIILLLLLFTSLMVIQPVATAQAEVSHDSNSVVETVVLKELDDRAKILAKYFAQYNSPLENYAQDFIDAADTYGMDWKLVPAIAGVESTFGKHIPGGHGEFTTYNAWGWGVYGDQALGFKSWRDGIFTVAGGLKNNYINKGLTDPLAMNHVYAASPTWGVRVNHFLGDLEQFTIEEEAKQRAELQSSVNEAGISAQIVSQ